MIFNRHQAFFIIFLFLCFMGFHSAFACKYNVRETGFIDLESRTYSLYIFVNESVEESERRGYSNLANKVLEETTVQFELVDVLKTPDHSAKGFLGSTDSFPVAVLVSPDGQLLNLPMENFKAEMTAIISSPKRHEIAKNVLKNYAVLLLIKGTNEEENKQAFEIARASVEHIESKMDMMPKTIDNPPVIVTIEQSDFPTENVLLWSLGLACSQITRPQIAILYGKSRWIGPLLSGDQLKKSNLVDLLLVIGADCECGLDKTWLQGTMLPVKWDLPLQKKVVENLGFDAENPYVRMEMMAIMRNSLVAPGTIPLHAFPDTSVQLDFAIVNTNLENETANAMTDSGKQSSPQNSINLVLLLLSLVLVVGIVLLLLK